MLVLNNANELVTVLDDKQKKTVTEWYQRRPWHRRPARRAGASDRLAVAQPSLLGPISTATRTSRKPGLSLTPSSVIATPRCMARGPSSLYSADWHNHDRSVSGLPGFRVLMWLDESSHPAGARPYFQQRGGKPMGKDHPAAWTHEAV